MHKPEPTQEMVENQELNDRADILRRKRDIALNQSTYGLKHKLLKDKLKKLKKIDKRRGAGR